MGFTINITEMVDNMRFDCEINISGQCFENRYKTLKQVVKWVNDVFNQDLCNKCNKYKNDKNRLVMKQLLKDLGIFASKLI